MCQFVSSCISLVESDDNVACPRKSGAHKRDLTVAFIKIVLIYADGVDPKDPILDPLPDIWQGHGKIPCSEKQAVVHGDG